MNQNNQDLNQSDELVNPTTLTYGLSKSQQTKMQSAKDDFITASSVVVNSPATYDDSAKYLITIKQNKKALTEMRLAITRPMDEAKKNVMRLFDEPIKRLDDAENIIKNCLLHYTREVEAQRRKQEAINQERARKEEEKLRKRAEQAEAKGKVEKAEVLHDMADSVPIPEVQTPAPKHTGLSTRKNWYAEITDEYALLKAIVCGDVPMAAVKFDMTFLNRQAVALKRELNYPGVIAKSKDSLAVRT